MSLARSSSSSGSPEQGSRAGLTRTLLALGGLGRADTGAADLETKQRYFFSQSAGLVLQAAGASICFRGDFGGRNRYVSPLTISLFRTIPLGHLRGKVDMHSSPARSVGAISEDRDE